MTEALNLFSYLLFPSCHHLFKLVEVAAVKSEEELHQPTVIGLFERRENWMGKLFEGGKQKNYPKNVFK